MNSFRIVVIYNIGLKFVNLSYRNYFANSDLTWRNVN